MIVELRRHIERKISDATLERLPFPHMVVEDFFPSEIYAKVLAYNPFIANVGEEWQSAAASNHVSSRTPYEARKQINFHANAAFDAEPEAAAFWNQVKGCFLSDHWFESVVQQKYADYFYIRFGELAETPKFLSHFRKELFLQRHEPGYYIGPHTDIPTRVVTCIFSFAAAPGFDGFGTELSAHKDPLVRCWGNDHYTPDDFVVRKVAPYRPNNFLLFFKTRQSFHAVKEIDDTVPNQRYGMQFQLYEPGNGLFKDLSVPDLMSTKIGAIPLRQPSSWVAKERTYLKRSTAPVATLPPADKIEFNAGEIVISERHQVQGGYSKLFGVTVDGRSLGTDWFIYTPSWDRHQGA